MTQEQNNENGGLEFEHLAQRFLDHCRSAVSLSAHTHRAYQFDLEDFSAHVGAATRADRIDKETLRGYIRFSREQRGLKESTIKRRIACLKLLFKWATQETLLAANPFDNLNERIRLPKRLPRALDRNDAKSLKAAIKALASDDFRTHGAKVAIQLMLATGIRVGELVALTIDDIDFANASLKIEGKGNRQRLVYLIDQEVLRQLSIYVARRSKHTPTPGQVFLTPAGQAFTTNDMRRLLSQIRLQAGIDRHITPHMLRHTSATTWLESGLDIRYVQRLLGHQSISTTEIYTHVTDEGLRGAMIRVGR